MSKDKISFSHKNYFSPTPRNLQYLMTSLKAVLSAIAGTSVYNDANEWFSISVIVMGVIVDQVANFFGRIVEEESHMTVDVPMAPGKPGEPTNNTITITHESTTEQPEQPEA